MSINRVPSDHVNMHCVDIMGFDTIWRNKFKPGKHNISPLQYCNLFKGIWHIISFETIENCHLIHYVMRPTYILQITFRHVLTGLFNPAVPYNKCSTWTTVKQSQWHVCCYWNVKLDSRQSVEIQRVILKRLRPR